MTRGVRCLAPTAALSLCLLGATTADAAKPFTLGNGNAPEVAVDAAGTGHFVWNINEPDGDDPLRYCQVKRGATACSLVNTFAPPLEAIGHDSYVFAPGGGRILIATHRCCGPAEGNYVYESTDGGVSFGPQEVVGNLDWEQGAVLGPGADAISGATRDEYQRMTIGGGPTTAVAELDPGFSVPTFAGLGIFNTSTPVLVASDGDHMAFHRYDGSGDPNGENNWIGPTPLTPIGNEPKLAGGPKGLVMLYTVGGKGTFQLAARKWGGTTFGPPIGVSKKDFPIESNLHAEPLGGRFHAVWNDNGSPDLLRWATSLDGIGWTKPTTLAKGSVVDLGFHYEVAAAPDRQGFTTWDANSNSGPVKAMPLDQLGGRPVDNVTVAGKQYTLFAPDACVASGKPALLRLTQKQKNKVAPSKRKKIDQVEFSVDAASKTDGKAAYEKSFSTQGFASKSTHQAKAKVKLKPADGDGGKTTKTLKGSFAVC